jgi:hypothetical protein
MGRSHGHGTSALAAFGRLLRTLFWIGVLGLAGWAAWRYGRPLLGKFKLNADLESAAINFANQLPEKAADQPELVTAVNSSANDKLKSYLSRKGRWHVSFGRSGADLTIVRDDSFTRAEMAFVARVVDAARDAAKPTKEHFESLEFPLGAVVERVDVGDERWFVAAVWCE